MGMYTQAMGMLNIASINVTSKKFEDYKEILAQAQTSYKLENPTTRSWLCDTTFIEMCGNASVFIFFGTELKNYDDDIETWIRYLIRFFPYAEGIVSSQYEQDEYAHLYFIYRGEIQKEMKSPIVTEGYGNGE